MPGDESLEEAWRRGRPGLGLYLGCTAVLRQGETYSRVRLEVVEGRLASVLAEGGGQVRGVTVKDLVIHTRGSDRLAWLWGWVQEAGRDGSEEEEGITENVVVASCTSSNGPVKESKKGGGILKSGDQTTSSSKKILKVNENVEVKEIERNIRKEKKRGRVEQIVNQSALPANCAIGPLPPLPSGSQFEALIVSTFSPDLLVARPLQWEGDYQAMLSSLPPCQPSPASLHPAASIHGCGWLRAIVLDNGQDSLIPLYLCDLGREAAVPASSLRPLQHQHLSLPRLALGLSLEGVSPCGEDWTRAARDMVSRLVCRQVQVKVRGRGTKDAWGLLPAFQASIAVAVELTEGPMEPAVIVMEQLATRLIMEGLALPAEELGREEKKEEEEPPIWREEPQVCREEPPHSGFEAK